MSIPLEYKVQGVVEDWLGKNGLWAFSVLYVSGSHRRGDLLKITFLMSPEIPEFLEHLGYPELADKSGIEVIPETKTILLYGLGLRLFFRLVENGN